MPGPIDLYDQAPPPPAMAGCPVAVAGCHFLPVRVTLAGVWHIGSCSCGWCSDLGRTGAASWVAAYEDWLWHVIPPAVEEALR